MWGQRLPKLQMCQKMCKAQNVQKQHFQGLANKVLERSMPKCSVCARVLCQPVQACSGPEALSSLPQLSPADSSQVRAQEPCPAAQRPRESAYHPGNFPEKLQGPGAFTVPRDVPRRSTWPGSPPAHRNCAQDENTWFSMYFDTLQKL